MYGRLIAFTLYAFLILFISCSSVARICTHSTLRVQWLRKLTAGGCQIATIIHPRAYVSPTAEVCDGAVILPGAVVNTNTRVGFGCIVNCGAIVDHDCVLEQGVHICLGAIVKAENRIPAFEKVEAGFVIQNRMYPL